MNKYRKEQSVKKHITHEILDAGYQTLNEFHIKDGKKTFEFLRDRGNVREFLFHINQHKERLREPIINELMKKCGYDRKKANDIYIHLGVELQDSIKKHMKKQRESYGIFSLQRDIVSSVDKVWKHEGIHKHVKKDL